MSKKIIVLTLSFGSGHVRAAQAVVAELHRQLPTAEIRMIDALENCSLFFRAFYVWTYWAMIRFAPQLWNKFFHARLERKDEQTAPVWAWLKGCSKVFTEIRNFQPDLIIACEVGASEIAVIARRENLTNAEIINVITDFEGEPIWCKPEISAYCVASEAVKTQLINWDVRAEKIKVCGIPLDESFTVKQDPAKIESNFKLNERPLILLMGGGMGPTRMDEVAADLLQYGENLQIVALPGRDLAVRQKLEKLANSKTVTLFVCGWTGQVAGLMQMATLLITKPGGLTLSEAAACGVPCVFFDAIPGPEEVNAERFVNLGAGILLKDAKETAKAALELLKDTEKLKEMAQSSRKLAQPNAAREIVKIALETLKLSLSNESIFVKPHQFSAYRRFSAFRRRLRLRKTNNLATNSEIIETFSKSSTEVKVR